MRQGINEARSLISTTKRTQTKSRTLRWTYWYRRTSGNGTFRRSTRTCSNGCTDTLWSENRLDIFQARFCTLATGVFRLTYSFKCTRPFPCTTPRRIPWTRKDWILEAWWPCRTAPCFRKDSILTNWRSCHSVQ